MQYGADTRMHSEGFCECIEQTHVIMSEDIGQQKLQEIEQRREVTEGQDSRAPRAAETTATRTRCEGECSGLQQVDTCQMEDVSVLMKRGMEKVCFSGDEKHSDDHHVVECDFGEFESGRVVLR